MGAQQESKVPLSISSYVRSYANLLRIEWSVMHVTLTELCPVLP